MRILRIGLPLQGRTFSYKSHIKVVRFILWDNLPARLCRCHFIRATRRKKQRARGNKPMLMEIAAAVSVVAADQASKAFVLSRSWPVDSNAGFLSVRKVLMRRGPNDVLRHTLDARRALDRLVRNRRRPGASGNDCRKRTERRCDRRRLGWSRRQYCR